MKLPITNPMPFAQQNQNQPLLSSFNNQHSIYKRDTQPYKIGGGFACKQMQKVGEYQDIQPKNQKPEMRRPRHRAK